MQGINVSVVLTVLNEGENLRKLLDDLMNQSLPPNEFVIVDGGSNDQTFAVLSNYASKDERFLILSEPGVNIARGRNIAISHARNPIIAVTDGGCRPDDRWLEELTRPLVESSAYSAVAGRVVSDPHSRFEYFAGLLCLPQESDDCHRRDFYGRSSAFTKDAWKAAGGYPEWLYTAEDTLFSSRFHQLSRKVAYAPASHLLWRPRKTLYKLGKMFFLYGVGNGRIARGRLRDSLYWLRFHAVLFISIIAGFLFPWFFLISVGITLYLYMILVQPALSAIRSQTNDLTREFFVPLIVLIRSFATHAGFLVGTWDFHHNPIYREKLNAYQKPRNARTESASSVT